MKNLYLNQINDIRKQLNYEREKSATESKELMKTIDKLEERIEDRELKHKEEVREQKSMKYSLLLYMVLALCIGFAFGMVNSHPYSTTIITSMGLFIAYFVNKELNKRK